MHLPRIVASRRRQCLSREKDETPSHGTPDFFVRVQDDPAFLVETKPNRKWETQLTFLGFVELAAQEARAQKMKFGLGHRSLQSQQKTVVEIRWVVATIFVDHQRFGEGA